MATGAGGHPLPSVAHFPLYPLVSGARTLRSLLYTCAGEEEEKEMKRVLANRFAGCPRRRHRRRRIYFTSRKEHVYTSVEWKWQQINLDGALEER